jgi:mitochondrial import inner membrane translocase subunit TIM8
MTLISILFHQNGCLLSNWIRLTGSLHAAVHYLSDVCWKKCVAGKITSGRLDRAEETCAQNCVERWMDANFAVLKHLEALRGQ